MKETLDYLSDDWKLSIYKKIRRIGKLIVKRKQYLNRIEEQLREQLPYSPAKDQIKWCYWDFFKYTVKYNAELDLDYFYSGIFRKSELVRQESFANRKRFAWRDSIQEKSQWSYFIDKSLFYKKYNNYLGRDYICADQTMTFEVFSDFVKKYNGDVFAKVPVSCGGKDVYHWKIITDDDMQKKYEEACQNSMIIEEKLTQTKEIAEFSPISVNTMRIITIIDDSGNVKVANAFFRIGNGNSIDNFSSGGIITKVDIDSGIICVPAVDRNGNQYIVHPISGKQIVGFKIPNWQLYIEFAVKLAEECKGMRYVGWDIIMRNDGRMCCIEGNKDAGVQAESINNYGYIPLYEAILHNDKSFDFNRYGGSYNTIIGKD